MLGSLILYIKGLRILMFQLSGFCYMALLGLRVSGSRFLSDLGGLSRVASFALCWIQRLGLRARRCWSNYSQNPRNEYLNLSSSICLNPDSTTNSKTP